MGQIKVNEDIQNYSILLSKMTLPQLDEFEEMMKQIHLRHGDAPGFSRQILRELVDVANRILSRNS
jgi:hypothetical protein